MLAALTLLPPLAAVTLFGCWCWATAVGHWFTGSSFCLWTLGWLMSFVPLGVAATLHDSGSGATSATVTLALGWSRGWPRRASASPLSQRRVAYWALGRGFGPHAIPRVAGQRSGCFCWPIS